MIYRWLKKNNDESENDIEPVEECAIEMIPEIEKLSVSQKFQIFLNPSIYLCVKQKNQPAVFYVFMNEPLLKLKF
jgi:hypothetical protein